MKKTEEQFSYFRGVNQTTPLMSTTLYNVYAKIKSFCLKEATENIRKELIDKDILPAVTFSGTFSQRRKDGLIKYSSLVCVDIDDLDDPHQLKQQLRLDFFLKPVLLFISPRGHGLKIVVRVKDGTEDNHGLYYESITRYLKGTYGIPADEYCKDISRLCWICWDPEPFWFGDGFVTSEALLKLIPATTPDRFLKPVRCDNNPAASFLAAISEKRYKKSAVSPACPTDDPVSDQLNKIPAVHQMAVDALKREGWQQKTDLLWTRPGKPVKDGHSATYNIYGPDGIYFLTNFSTEAPNFTRNKPYTDVGIICELDYNGDFKQCISALAQRFLEPDHAYRGAVPVL
jgi:hypothetical protein